MAQIKLLISDFDGTLVNTFKANYLAYKDAFSAVGRTITEKEYRECFGFRFDDFMKAMRVHDVEIAKEIRKIKGESYPKYFSNFIVNTPLLEMIKSFRLSGGFTAVASTARKKNLMNALHYIGAEDAFSYILAGEDVSKGKPNPEIYKNVLQHFKLDPKEALVFEDSEVGMQAASNAGIGFVRVVL